MPGYVATRLIGTISFSLVVLSSGLGCGEALEEPNAGVTAGTGNSPGNQAASAGSSSTATSGSDASGSGGSSSGSAGAPSPAGTGATTSFAGASATTGGWRDETRYGVGIADAVLQRWPNANDIAPDKNWEYNNAIVLYALQRIYEGTGDARYADYIKEWVDRYVGASGNVPIPTEHTLDRIQPAVLLPFLEGYAGDGRYATAATTTYELYGDFPRNGEGGFWHKERYPEEMWLDSAFMGLPFLARYAGRHSCSDCLSTISQQITLLAEHTYDASSELFRHGWDADANATWADPDSGIAPYAWSRGLGWFAITLVDVIPSFPASSAERGALLVVLDTLAAGIAAVQDADTGLWYQVLDAGDQSDNWLETSGSAMFIYALKKGVDRGWLDADYLAVAQAGWDGLKNTFDVDSQGTVSVTGAVEGMGIQATYAGYVGRTRLSNSPHGLCAAMLACSQMESF